MTTPAPLRGFPLKGTVPADRLSRIRGTLTRNTNLSPPLVTIGGFFKFQPEQPHESFLRQRL